MTQSGEGETVEGIKPIFVVSIFIDWHFVCDGVRLRLNQEKYLCKQHAIKLQNT